MAPNKGKLMIWVGQGVPMKGIEVEVLGATWLAINPAEMEPKTMHAVVRVPEDGGLLRVVPAYLVKVEGSDVFCG